MIKSTSCPSFGVSSSSSSRPKPLARAFPSDTQLLFEAGIHEPLVVVATCIAESSDVKGFAMCVATPMESPEIEMIRPLDSGADRGANVLIRERWTEWVIRLRRRNMRRINDGGGLPDA